MTSADITSVGVSEQPDPAYIIARVLGTTEPVAAAGVSPSGYSFMWHRSPEQLAARILAALSEAGYRVRPPDSDNTPVSVGEQIGDALGLPAPHVASASDIVEEAQRQHDLLRGVLDALYLEPCHITGMHTPNHHTYRTCSSQRDDVLQRVLTALGMTETDLGHKLHKVCFWCHRVPQQEDYRQQLRESYRWAGVLIPDELAAPGPVLPTMSPQEAVSIPDAAPDEEESDGKQR